MYNKTTVVFLAIFVHFLSVTLIYTIDRCLQMFDVSRRKRGSLLLRLGGFHVDPSRTAFNQATYT